MQAIKTNTSLLAIEPSVKYVCTSHIIPWLSCITYITTITNLAMYKAYLALTMKVLHQISAILIKYSILVSSEVLSLMAAKRLHQLTSNSCCDNNSVRSFVHVLVRGIKNGHLIGRHNDVTANMAALAVCMCLAASCLLDTRRSSV